MKISHEFTVSVPIDVAWRVLTDLEGIAPCLPGAHLTSVDGGVYSGTVTVKVGPMISEFAGTARFAEKDDDAYRAVIDAKGRDARTAGTAAAVISARLRPAGDATVVTVDTDLKISGKLAQFGGGMIREVSQKLLGQFVTSLEAKIAANQNVPAAVGDTPPAEADVQPPAAPPQPRQAQPGQAQPGQAQSGQARLGQAQSGQAQPGQAQPGQAGEPAPLDLVALAGGSIRRRVVPMAIGAALVVAAIVVWRVVR